MYGSCFCNCLHQVKQYVVQFSFRGAIICNLFLNTKMRLLYNKSCPDVYQEDSHEKFKKSENCFRDSCQDMTEIYQWQEKSIIFSPAKIPALAYYSILSLHPLCLPNCSALTMPPLYPCTSPIPITSSSL